MKSYITAGLAIVAAFAAAVSPAQAGSTTGLADWCVSLSGDVSTACNYAGTGGASPNGGSIDLSNFDQSNELFAPYPANNLGSVVVNLAAGDGQYVSFYADYDLDYNTYGSFLDSATAIFASLPNGLSYELEDPNSGDLYNQFAANTLNDTNSVATGATSAQGGPCCDAAFAVSLSNLNVGATGGTVTFNVSTSAPASGTPFYIQQTNIIDGDSIYLTYTTSGDIVVTPEPSTLLLFAGAFLAMSVFLKRFRAVRAL